MFAKTKTRSGRNASTFKSKPESGRCGKEGFGGERVVKRKKKVSGGGRIGDGNKENDSSNSVDVSAKMPTSRVVSSFKNKPKKDDENTKRKSFGGNEENDSNKLNNAENSLNMRSGRIVSTFENKPKNNNNTKKSLEGNEENHSNTKNNGDNSLKMRSRRGASSLKNEPKNKNDSNNFNNDNNTKTRSGHIASSLKNNNNTKKSLEENDSNNEDNNSKTRSALVASNLKNEPKNNNDTKKSFEENEENDSKKSFEKNEENDSNKLNKDNNSKMRSGRVASSLKNNPKNNNNTKKNEESNSNKLNNDDNSTKTRSGRVVSTFKNKPKNNNTTKNGGGEENKENDSNKLNDSDNINKNKQLNASLLETGKDFKTLNEISEKDNNLSKPKQRTSFNKKITRSTKKQVLIKSPQCVLERDPTMEKLIKQAMNKKNAGDRIQEKEESNKRDFKSEEEKCVSSNRDVPSGIEGVTESDARKVTKRTERVLKEKTSLGESGVVTRRNLRAVESRKVGETVQNAEEVVENPKRKGVESKIKTTDESETKQIKEAEKGIKEVESSRNSRPTRKRIQKKIDYNEITLSTSQKSVDTTVVKKTGREPVYLKRRESPSKPKKDVYEFREDVERTASEEEFEEGMASLIEQLEKRFNTKKRVPRKKVKKNVEANKGAGAEMNSSGESVPEKNSNNKQSVFVKNVNFGGTPMEKVNFASTPIKHVNFGSAPMENVNFGSTLKKNVNFTGTPMKTVQFNQDERKESIEIFARRESSDGEDNYVSSPPHEFTAPFHTPYQVITPQIPESNNKSVQILSDILLDKQTPRDDFRIGRPNANSTMLAPDSPWRPVLALKRNPFFLKMKKSSLPEYDQEMVIDYNLEKSLISPSITDKSPLVSRRKPRQASILNYVNSTIVTAEPENEFNYSLFDADQLSPVKNKTSPKKQALKDSTNIQPTKVKNLSVFNDSVSFFGENPASPVKMGKPCRLSVNEVKRVVFGNKKRKENPPDPQKELDRLNENETGGDELNGKEDFVDRGNAEEIDAPAVGLFEEFIEEKAPPKASYTRRGRTKRQRYVSCNEDSETEEVPVKKKKNEMTKKEELEFEKMAAKYNEMFKEIETFKLEVE